jgi:hypothetical protein
MTFGWLLAASMILAIEGCTRLLKAVRMRLRPRQKYPGKAARRVTPMRPVRHGLSRRI